MMDNELFELCTVDDCDNKYLARGYCRRHYSRWYKGKDITGSTHFDERIAVIDGDTVKIPIGLNAKDGYALVDPENASLSRHKWFLGGSGYPATNTSKGVVNMHKFVIGSEDGFVTDHVNTNKLDNRRANLRLVTRSQNNTNRGANKVRKDSKYKGVILHSSGRWTAKIGFNNKRISLGYFDTEKEAANAYDKAALVYHREYAYVNDDELRELLVNVREKLGWIVTSSDDLLEKLPEWTRVQKIGNDTGKYSASYELDYTTSLGDTALVGSSDTPLKALLKLTIALSEAGELK
jgi:hypothetical protein